MGPSLSILSLPRLATDTLERPSGGSHIVPQNKARRCLFPARCEGIYWLCLKLWDYLQLMSPLAQKLELQNASSLPGQLSLWPRAEKAQTYLPLARSRKTAKPKSS